MKNLFFLTLCISLGLLACKQKAEPTKIDDSGYKYFGAEITDKDAITYDELLKKLTSVDSLETKVTGTVASVCQVKGCWANIISDTDPEGQKMFVKFKDYGFFLPLDCEGKKVTMRGKAYREVTPVDELRHYAEDEGKSAEEIAAITEPIEELKFMADGVILLP